MMNEIVVTGLGANVQQIAGSGNSLSQSFCAIEMDDYGENFFTTPKSLVRVLLRKRGTKLIFKNQDDEKIFEKMLPPGPQREFKDLKKAGVIIIKT